MSSGSTGSDGDDFFEEMFRGGSGDRAGDEAPDAEQGGPSPDAGTPADPEPRASDHRERGDVRWKLRRGDGSEWTVTELSLAPNGLRVDAYRYVREAEDPARTRQERLEAEPLERDDRVWCLNREGAVVWTLSSPEAGDVAEPDIGPAGEPTGG